MQSPFPGMDPYLEDPAFWEDFHRRLITGIADYLLERLPPNYDARIDQRVRLTDADSGASMTRLPDVALSDVRPGCASNSGVGAMATFEPVTLPMPEIEEKRDVWIEIVRLPERSLVTAIEVLSPSNKSGEGLLDYASKRLDLYGHGVNLVELDLLLAGKRLHFSKPLPPGDYYASVATAARRPLAEVYAWSLPDPLPTISVPLRAPDPSVPLDLRTVYTAVYDRGRYASHLRYDGGVPPWLPPKYADWVGKMVTTSTP